MATVEVQGVEKTGFSLDDFVRACVDEALALGGRGMPVEEFFDSLNMNVAIQMGYTSEQVERLSRPAYWALVCRTGNSLLNYVQARKPEDVSIIELAREYTVADLGEVVDDIGDRCGVYLMARAGSMGLTGGQNGY